MTSFTKHSRIAIAGVLAAAAIGSAAPAQADTSGKADRCDARLERIEDRFRQIEEKRGWDAAAGWWDQRWAAYYANCLAP